MSKHKPDCPTDAALSRAKHQRIDSPVFDELTTEARRECLREARQDRATLARAYRAEKERRESAERVVEAARICLAMCDTPSFEGKAITLKDCILDHRAKYPKESNDD